MLPEVHVILPDGTYSFVQPLLYFRLTELAKCCCDINAVEDYSDSLIIQFPPSGNRALRLDDQSDRFRGGNLSENLQVILLSKLQDKRLRLTMITWLRNRTPSA